MPGFSLGSSGTRRLHLVHWDDVCQPTTCGGLGICPAKESNLAMLSKISWRMHKNEDKLWARFWRVKHCRGSLLCPTQMVYKRGSSYVWRGIVEAYNAVITKGLGRSVHNGRAMSFWMDSWLLDDPLHTQAMFPLYKAQLVARVCDFWSPGSGWKWGELDDLLPNAVLLR